MTVREAALRLEVAPQTVYQLCARRQLRHSRIGNGRGVIRIPEEAIAEYLKAAEVGPAAPKPTPAPRVVLKHLRG